MIIQLLLQLIIGVASFFLNLLPELSLPENFVASFGDVSEVTDLIAYFLPVKTFLICLGLYFTINNIHFILSIVNWIIRKIPSIN